MPHHTEEELLRRFRSQGAARLERVTFRRNRSTIWSLTRGGRALNLHEALRAAPEEVVTALGLLAREGGRGRRARRAAERVRAWRPLTEAVRRIRREDAGEEGGGRALPACAGTAEQGAWLRDAYAHFNRTRFGGRLPADLPLRFSRRMTRSLGHMRPAVDAEGGRVAREIALNLDLLLPGNDAELVDTLLHEMAHVADWLVDGERRHGATWRRWAARAGCTPRTRHHGGFRRRRPRSAEVRRVPPRPWEDAGGR